MSKWIQTTFCCALMTVIALAAGCGGGEPEAIAPPKPVVKYPTAQSLIADLNRLAAEQPPNVKAMTALYKAENPGQREWVSFMNAVLPIYELSVEMERQFGEGFDPSQSAFEMGLGGTATLVEDQGERAEAEHKDMNGKKSRLYLVKLEGNWWISGYTFEYDPDLQKITAEERAQSLAGIDMMKGVTSGVLSRLRAGEFDSAQDVREAVFLAMAQKARAAEERSGGTAFGTQ